MKYVVPRQAVAGKDVKTKVAGEEKTEENCNGKRRITLEGAPVL